ncbi:Protein LTO1, partial [Galemys pyrenaicus]
SWEERNRLEGSAGEESQAAEPALVPSSVWSRVWHFVVPGDGSENVFQARHCPCVRGQAASSRDRFHGEGFQEGYEEGSSLGMAEGRRHGTLHGAKIGSEIGCYQGFACAWRSLLHGCATEKDSKKVKVLESLIGMIQKFPYDDPTYGKLHEDLQQIRGKFKQVRPEGSSRGLCSLLNVQPDFKVSAGGPGLAF